MDREIQVRHPVRAPRLDPPPRSVPFHARSRATQAGPAVTPRSAWLVLSNTRGPWAGGTTARACTPVQARKVGAPAFRHIHTHTMAAQGAGSQVAGPAGSLDSGRARLRVKDSGRARLRVKDPGRAAGTPPCGAISARVQTEQGRLVLENGGASHHSHACRVSVCESKTSARRGSD